ncbi:OLC1v1015935C1 [Oldenlandia corymbosa var. corymbosa]|uniref:OLC1v1015935C1 n=1 Tax=Oldenlandia corymbosa var. corymbosa TaxID=529605 RepID=A0AAV1E4D1_OLDCO|nr:OLC1v1015935C1 [Oldenlandia corymbosa var. corymbosa]
MDINAIKGPGQWLVTPNYLRQGTQASKLPENFSTNPLHFLGHDTPGPSTQQTPGSWYEKAVPRQPAYIPPYGNFTFDGKSAPPISNQYQPFSVATTTKGVPPDPSTAGPSGTYGSNQQMYAEETVYIQDRLLDGSFGTMTPYKIFKGSIPPEALQTTATTAPVTGSATSNQQTAQMADQQSVAVGNRLLAMLGGSSLPPHPTREEVLEGQGQMNNLGQHAVGIGQALQVNANPTLTVDQIELRQLMSELQRDLGVKVPEPVVNQAQCFAIEEEDEFEDINAAEIVNMKGYKCSALKKPSTPQAYGEAIFEDMLKNGHVTYRKGQGQPKPADIEGKTYCMYHMSMTHGTNDCVVFRNVIQKMIDDEDIQIEEPTVVMIEPFPVNHVIGMIDMDPRANAYARQKVHIGCPDCDQIVDSIKEEVCRLGSMNGGHLHQRNAIP